MSTVDPNGFSTKEIVVRMEAKIDYVLADHETRLRNTEAAISRLKGALVLMTVLIPLGIALIVTYGPHH
jgi:hypothetical protein